MPLRCAALKWRALRESWPPNLKVQSDEAAGVVIGYPVRLLTMERSPLAASRAVAQQEPFQRTTNRA